MRRRAVRSQALVEFAMVVALLMMLIVTSFSLVPAITARGVVLDAAASALERGNRFLTPVSEAAEIAATRTAFCTLVLETVRAQIMATGLAVTAGADGCQPAITTSMNPVVHFRGAAPGSFLPGSVIQVCVAYEYRITDGLLFVASRAPGEISTTVRNRFTYAFCGESVIYAKRSR